MVTGFPIIGVSRARANVDNRKTCHHLSPPLFFQGNAGEAPMARVCFPPLGIAAILEYARQRRHSWLVVAFLTPRFQEENSAVMRVKARSPPSVQSSSRCRRCLAPEYSSVASRTQAGGASRPAAIAGSRRDTTGIAARSRRSFSADRDRAPGGMRTVRVPTASAAARFVGYRCAVCGCRQ